ncbi:MAG: pyruvate dehydrogenase complex E1 component subunit beta [Candidatus Bathyarchaeia archaeon]
MQLSELDLIEIYRYMVLARKFDEKLIERYRMPDHGGVIELPHSHIGQEAIGVGACYKLRPDDYIVPSLRTRPALLMRVSAKELMAGIFGKSTGPAKGKVTTHHMGDNERGIIGTTGVVGGHLCLATGVALACKLRGRDSVVLCFMGDGATQRGDFHEALNFAALKKLPVIFIIENNMYASWTPFHRHSPIENLADRAVGYGIDGIIVDGNDVLAVHETVQKAVMKARKGHGPTLIECKTYRLRDHAEIGYPERRPKEEIEAWAKKDPLIRYKNFLFEKGVLTPELAEKIEKDIERELDEAIEFAEKSPFPEPDEVLKDVYGEPLKYPALDVERKGAEREVSFGEALNEALREEMRRDPSVIILGEDVGPDTVGPIRGGIWPPTRGLCDEFPDRVIGTPISESVIAGAAVGAALLGMRPVTEIMFADFLTIAMDQIANVAAKIRYNYGGKASVPIVIRAPFGAGTSMGLHHSQSPEAWFLNIPGLKIVMPSTPYDAKGLLKASIRDEDPVIFFEQKTMYGLRGKIPEGEYVIPLGEAAVKRKGSDVTIVATGLMVHEALRAAEILEKHNISAEVVDPRTLLPLDEDTILASVKKTGRLIIAHEAPVFGGFGGEVAAIVAEKALGYLDAPIVRVGAPFAPVPFSPPLEQFYMPNKDKIVAATLKIFEAT